MKARDRDPTRLRLERANLRLRHELRTTYRVVDQALRVASKDVVPSCRKGCAACCRQLTGCTTLEAAHIALTYPDVVRERLPVLREHHAAIETDAITLGVQDLNPGDPAQRLPLCDAWWQAHRRCAFLNADDTCAIYDARPLACRTWLVTSDPVLCDSAEPADVTYLRLDGIERVHLRLLAKCGDYGRKASYGHLPTMVLDQVEG